MSLLAHAVFELSHPQLQAGELIDIDSTDVRRLLSVFLTLRSLHFLRNIKNQIGLLEIL
ncbi:MAG: hypothetical protein V7L31_13285 [Nostoc sp.]|uniref:hypothetical protein n=1 Tax=Nostoc sp. TaxID=1180 RepID=UPI002FEFAEBD